MGLVDLARRGHLDHDSLMFWLLTWDYEPRHRAINMADDGDDSPNSFEAIQWAHFSGVITDDEMGQIVHHLFATGVLPD